MRLPPPVRSSHPDPWFTRLNQQGPGANPIPVIDDEPPFYLPRPSPDTGSYQALQPDRLSSHAPPVSQPAPLSHSLLSQLELSEHDPNTYRDIIDDLTVQNKKLRRRLKRYAKDYSIATSQDGLFEVRVRRLPSEKRRELERILQDFLSTIPSFRERSTVRSEDLRTRASLRRQEPENARKPTQSPSPNIKGLDSAYASVSATGGTVSGAEDRSNIESSMQATSNLDRILLSDSDRVLRGNGDCNVSDIAKQKVVIARLEMLFSDRGSDQGPFYGPTLQIETSKVGSREGSTALAKVEPSTTFAEEQLPVASETTSSVDFGVSAPATDRLSDLPAAPPQHLLIGSDFPDPNLSRASLDHWHRLRQLGAASPVPGSNPQFSHGWVYLNLLVNMAQLHTLNVTLDFVRQAIHAISDNLVLSEDGRKVRWREERSNNHPGTLAEANDVYMSLDSPQASPSSQSKQRGDVSHGSKDQKRHLPFIPKIESSPTEAHTTSFSRRRKLQAREFDYKPMFLHNKDRLRQNGQLQDQDSSYESETSSSTSEGTTGVSHGSKHGVDRRAGPMVFFNHDPFFLDLSADPPVHESANGHSSYINPEAQPLGSDPPPVTRSSSTHEKKREWAPSTRRSIVTIIITTVGNLRK
ncbi:MAG: hypothetical protein LQ352_003766 [Teloschistes flavicans]|nr:MAG: hypothetical protein LQ352_003766 [Teloschistes flavicans]